jgi:DNA-binding NtrC family response regulator
MHLPPLRERRDDIPLLAKQILSNNASISTGALDALASHGWPGNVRELKGVLEAAANLARGGEILSEHLRLPAKPAARGALRSTADRPVETLAQVERGHILAIYERLGGNKTQTAKVLEIGLQTLHRKLKAYGVK